jgi:hypothetical protein
MNGMLANSNCDECCVFLMVATPITVSTAPAPKLTSAEKHIILLFNSFT